MNCQAGDIELVEYGYKKVGFILDRGYFSKENIQYMDRCGYEFVIMVKGMSSFVSELILENREKFENVREYGIFVLLGVENQSEIHYAMPVKNMVYDAMEYSTQVNEAARFHRNAKDYASGAEFLSGFRKEDKLTPVITLTLYWGADKWDAPRTLHEMKNDKYKAVLKYVDDYHLHLIIPNEITDFSRFWTSLGEVLEFIKASDSEEMMMKVINDNPKFKNLENEAISAINVFTGTNIPLNSKGGRTDMCKAWEEHRNSGIKEGRKEGKDIINRLILCLAHDGRIADIEKAASDSVYQDELIQYYGLDKETPKQEV